MIQETLRSKARGGAFADPGQKWEATDYIMDPSLPRRRMILGGQVGNLWLVYYEHGGFAKHEHLVAASVNPDGSVTIFKNLYGPNTRLTTLSEAENFLKQASATSAVDEF